MLEMEREGIYRYIYDIKIFYIACRFYTAIYENKNDKTSMEFLVYSLSGNCHSFKMWFPVWC